METRSARFGLVLAALAAIALERFVPGGRLLLYPFTLLATWVHEMGHGVGALLVGGGFDHLEIFWDASGIAYTSVAEGWRSAFVSAAGLLGPPLAGAVTLALARGPRRGGFVLTGIALALLVSVVFWVRSLVGVVTMLPLAALFAVLGLRGGRVRLVLAQLVGLLFAVDTLARFDYLFAATARVGGAAHASDVAGIAAGLSPPALLWGVVIAVLDLGLLGVGLRAAWAPDRAVRTGAAPRPPVTATRRVTPAPVEREQRS